MYKKNQIKFYFEYQEYGCFSNYYKSNFFLDGKLWITTEHYFQAQKFIYSPSVLEKCRTKDTPGEAKHMTKEERYKKNLDPRWHLDCKNIQVMKKCLYAKFQQNKQIKKILLSTGNKTLTEHTKNDHFWADGGDGTGENHLGRCLMELRSTLMRENQERPVLIWLDHSFDKFKQLVVLFQQNGIKVIQARKISQVIKAITKYQTRANLIITNLFFVFKQHLVQKLDSFNHETRVLCFDGEETLKEIQKHIQIAESNLDLESNVPKEDRYHKGDNHKRKKNTMNYFVQTKEQQQQNSNYELRQILKLENYLKTEREDSKSVNFCCDPGELSQSTLAHFFKEHNHSYGTVVFYSVNRFLFFETFNWLKNEKKIIVKHFQNPNELIYCLLSQKVACLIVDFLNTDRSVSSRIKKFAPKNTIYTYFNCQTEKTHHHVPKGKISDMKKLKRAIKDILKKIEKKN
ncbi:hypothetical protein M0812_18242 [Anaeramoeba flamelloides]|uniref:NADAR domain-containing protein n=1 Tax=Anaeramoeba flamelloides TaxID=1746091 RepID=A0AAV7Z791_9EUKA|nr:hypothetical protein M0812_18242 [Anaeramoeba flamelloides]